MEQKIRIYYGGSKEQWKKITVTGDNEALQYAEMHYNCDPKNIIVSQGNCGKSLKYKLDIKGNLTISGTGKMQDFVMYHTPWHDFPVLTVTLKEGITSLCAYAFSDASIISFSTPNSLVTIGDNCFHQCHSLTDVEFSSGVTDIHSDIFFDCGNLSSIKVDEKNPKYYSKNNCLISRDTKTLIRGCANSIIPTNVESFASNAFSGTKMSTIKIPESVKEIGWEAFENCCYLKSISLPDGLKEIDVHCFARCTELTSIIIPSSVTYIDEGAFFECEKLSTIYFKGTKTQWNNIKINRKNEQCRVISFVAVYGENGWEFIEKPLTDKNVCIDKAKVQYVCNCFNPKNYTTKATTTKDGKIDKACSVCGKVIKTVVIPKIASISLSPTSYTYDGKVKTPTVTVKDSKKNTLKYNTDYTITYASGRKTPGQYAVKITFKGNYSGCKTLYFTILPGVTSKIATATNSSVIKIAWKAVPGATGYRVFQYNTKTKQYVTLKTTTGTSYTVTKLKSGTSYKFAVRAYTIVNGKVFWASGYKTVTATTNPGTPTLKVTAGKKKAALSWNKQTGATGYVVYMATSKTGKYSKIATLKGNSKVSYTKTGLTKGKTYYFKVAAYTVANGKTLYSSFSSVKAVKIK